VSEPQIPVLEGWVTLAEAALMLGVRKQSVHKMTKPRPGGQPPRITTLHRLGRERPVYIVREQEIHKIAREQGERIREYQRRSAKGSGAGEPAQAAGAGVP
jgi:hypothetical protein